MRSPGVQGLGLDVGAQRQASGGGGGGVGANLLTWTEQFQNGTWVKVAASAVADLVNDPLGNLTADAIAFATASGSIGQTSAIAAATGSTSANATPTSTWTRFSVTTVFDTGTYTFSCWLLDPLNTGFLVRLTLDVSGGFIRCRLRDVGDLASFDAWGAKLETGSTATGTAATYGMRTT